MLLIFIIYASFNHDIFSQNKGKSPFSLLIFYIFGKYIDKYSFHKKNKKIYRFLICIICSFIFLFISWITFIINTKNSLNQLNSFIITIFKIEINSFPMILQSVALTIFIAQIQFNNYISRFITFIGPLTFDIYLIHENTYIRRSYIKNSFNQYSLNLNISLIFLLIFKKALLIFNVSIILAYLRNFLFRICKIKKICSIFETTTERIINYLF